MPSEVEVVLESAAAFCWVLAAMARSYCSTKEDTEDCLQCQSTREVESLVGVTEDREECPMAFADPSPYAKGCLVFGGLKFQVNEVVL